MTRLQRFLLRTASILAGLNLLAVWTWEEIAGALLLAAMLVPALLWRRARLGLAALLVALYALPVAKNLVLYARYQHGSDEMRRVAGPPGLLGVWEGTIDAFPCGFDMRYEQRLTLGPDSTGFLTLTILDVRVGGVYPSLYGWSALLPFDHSEASVEVRPVRLLDERHLEIASPASALYPRIDLWALETDGPDRLRFGYVERIGATRAGNGYEASWPADLHDLLYPSWGRW